MAESTDLAYPDALPANTRLHCYALERVLGQGGFAITYLARDTYLDQSVAIKEYFPVDVAHREAGETVRARTVDHRERYRWGLDRFLFEARTLARFDHPNIVRVLSVFEQNGTAYMVMRYENGANLAALLDQRHTLPESQLLGILLPILDGIELVHEAKFIHRDIKPDNIYIRSDDSPVLLDFGSARQALGKPRTMTALVTSGYTPFEQYQSDTCGPWTDIYSLGATCYRAISGVSPADALTRVKSSLGSLDDPLVPAQVVGQARYSKSLLAAIDQALRISEKERPQTVREWRDMIAPSRSARSHRAEVVDRAENRQAPKVDIKSAPDDTGSSSERTRKAAERAYRWTPVLWAAGVSGVVSVVVVSAWLFLAPQPNPNPTAATQIPPPQTPLPSPSTPISSPEIRADEASLPEQPKSSSIGEETAASKPPAATADQAVKPAAPPIAKKIPSAQTSLAPRSVTPERGTAAFEKVVPPTVGPTSAPPVKSPIATAPPSESAPPPAKSMPPVEAAATPTAQVAPVAIAPAAPVTAERSVAIPPKEPDSPARPLRATKPADTPADDETLAGAGDPDALLRVGEGYAAGKSGHPNPFFAYVYFKLAVIAGKSEAEGRLREQARKLQPPEIKQADSKVDSLRRSFAASVKEKVP